MADSRDKDKVREWITVKLDVDGLGERTYRFAGCSIREAYLAAFDDVMLRIYAAEFGAENAARLLAETDPAAKQVIAEEHMERADFWFAG